jgi:hypothetical protein
MFGSWCAAITVAFILTVSAGAPLSAEGRSKAGTEACGRGRVFP